MVISEYKPMSDVSVKRFISDSEDIVIYIINTGFIDKYIVVFEDAYEDSIGKTFIGSKEEIRIKFNINL